MWWKKLEKTIETVVDANVVSSISPEAQIASTAILNESKGGITIQSGVKVCPGAYIQGPIFIGENTLIGNNTMIRGPSFIGSNVLIGFSAEVKNAVILDDVSIGPMCYVADSFVEAGAYLGAMVRTSNHRLDKKPVSVMVDGNLVESGCEKLGAYIGSHSSLGAQVIILPGRIIAPGTRFGPRITVEKNLPAGTYRLAQQLAFDQDKFI